MKLLKTIVACTVLVSSIFMMTGCGGEGSALVKDVEFLTVSEYWYHFDELTGENEKMSFKEDGSFYWGCECGEPVGNSDCYELYDYDKGISVIKLYNGYDDTSMKMELISYSDYHILLKIDGKIKNYTYTETGLEVSGGEKYLSGYSGEFTVIDGNDEEVVLGPFDYDGDVEYPEAAIETYELSDDVDAYTLYTYKHIVDGETIEDSTDYQQISFEELVANFEYGGHSFVWFNDELKIEKILFYGDRVFEE